MKKKLTIILVCAVILITAILAVIHLNNDEINDENSITLICGGKTVTVTLSQLDCIQFSGTLVNGKGEKTDASFRGVELKELLANSGMDISELRVTQITATAQDQFSANLTPDEVLEADKVFVAVSRDGNALPGLADGENGAQLIVFGDPNSKRCVSYLESIELEINE